MQQYFVNFNSSDQHIVIQGEDVHHIKNVMRMKIDDGIYVSNGKELFFASIKEIHSDSIKAELFYEVKKECELPHYVSIAQGMPKATKFEMIIQKTTELGVGELIPVLSKRSLIKVNDKTESKKLPRFNKIAKSAAEQSHRLIVPEVKPFMNFKELIDYSKKFEHKLVAYEASNEDERLNLFNTFHNLNKDDKILIFIGPEGGLTQDEVNLLKAHDFIIISLGNRILRTETAPIFVMSAITYELELKG